MRHYYTNKCLNCSNQIKYMGQNCLRVVNKLWLCITKAKTLKMETEKGKIVFS